MSSFPMRARLVACEKQLKLAAPRDVLRRGALAMIITLAMFGASARAAQPETPAAAAAGEAETASHGNEIVGMIARLVNFGLLGGTLFYLLRSPIAGYLASRSTQIRRDLVDAAALKQSAAAQLEEIDRKMRALPAELDALREQGAQEIAAEEERIRAAAALERDRLLEQARREIELQVKVAERDLVNHAANLAVAVATERIKNNITDEDQKRLVDRYVSQLH